MTLKNNRAPLLFYIKLRASFQSHRWIQTKVIVRKHSIRVKIGDFLPSVTLKFDGWPWKKNRAPLLCCFKLCASFHSHRWIQTKATVRKRLIRGQNRRFIVLCVLQIWRMTLKNYRAPLLCCFKLYVSFQKHRRIQTKVTVRKRSIRVKIADFLSPVTLKFDEWLWKTIGHLFYATFSLMHNFIVNGEFKLELQSGNAQCGSKSAIFLSRVTLKFDRWPWKTIRHLF